MDTNDKAIHALLNQQSEDISPWDLVSSVSLDTKIIINLFSLHNIRDCYLSKN